MSMINDKKETKIIENRMPNADEYVAPDGSIHKLSEIADDRTKQERNKGDFTQYLIEYSKSKKQVILHTWVYKGMKGVILKVDLKNRVFTFFNATNKKTAIYSINIVRGIEEV